MVGVVVATVSLGAWGLGPRKASENSPGFDGRRAGWAGCGLACLRVLVPVGKGIPGVGWAPGSGCGPRPYPAFTNAGQQV